MKSKAESAMVKKMILAAIRENDMLPRPIRDHMGDQSHPYEDCLDHYTITMPSGKKVSVECAAVDVGGLTETFVYDIIELK